MLICPQMIYHWAKVICLYLVGGLAGKVFSEPSGLALYLALGGASFALSFSFKLLLVVMGYLQI